VSNNLDRESWKLAKSLEKKGCTVDIDEYTN
jgi:hypothetical protein